MAVSTDLEEILDTAFLFPEADILIRSADGVGYRMHSQTLRITSHFFRTMLSLPQKSSDQILLENHSRLETISMDESAKILSILFRIIYALEISSWESFDEFVSVLDAARKYDMPGPISMLRLMLLSPVFLLQPLRLYAVAAQFGWQKEAKMASECTLTLNIYDDEYESTLKTIPIEYFLKLIKLHHGRQLKFREMLNNPIGLFDAGNAVTVAQCGINCTFAQNNHPWHILKIAIIHVMDRRPKGDTILQDIVTRAAAEACWEAKCPMCSRKLYSKDQTITNLEECLNQLPSSIEDI
ncbi:hypothetical protein HWV62_35348 [Athelia sp. TMB]|nr:hypothetical protein HWV62_30043 [Athelia sp. TMB]KAF7986349.1 hypothetical protein HWV62_35348 [Athelia sp. TMB]